VVLVVQTAITLRLQALILSFHRLLLLVEAVLVVGLYILELLAVLAAAR
jgi:hypothetical protein